MKKAISFILTLVLTVVLVGVVSVDHGGDDVSVVSNEVVSVEGESKPIVNDVVENMSQSYLETSSKATSEETPVAKVGNQIELYVGGQSVKLDDILGNNYLDYSIDDVSVASVVNGRIVPQSEGFTFITATYNDGTVNKNIIVHSGLSQINSIAVDGVVKSTANVTVGKKYKLSVNNGFSDFTDIRVKVSTDYADKAEASDFIVIGDNGEIEIVGVGECDILLKSKTNRIDDGKVLHIKSDFSDSTLRAAVDRYFVSNNYERAVNGAYTKNELKIIDKLTFKQLTKANSTWVYDLPNLKTICYDLTSLSTSLGAFQIGKDSYDYEFIGSASKTYNFTLSTLQRSDLNIKFTNLNYKSSTTPLNLSETSNANIDFNGQCSISCNVVSGDNFGIEAIKCNSINMELQKDANVTIKGGNGGSGAVNSSNPHNRAGGAGIVASSNINIGARGYSSHTSISIIGGDGGSGSGYGNSGGNGAVGIQSRTLALDGFANYIISGGNGGYGVGGSNGTQPSARGKAPNGSYPDAKGDDGATGFKGGAGQDGGRGGDAGAAVVATSVILNGNKISFKSGSGGNGGVGGTGGTGGTGGIGGTGGGGYKFPWWYDGDGGTGGNGGVGGTGGNGGNGGDVPYVLQVNAVELGDYSTVSIEVGKPGAGGRGGNGGVGGKGGRGGDASTGNADSARNGDGGYGGVGGTGGRGGNAGKAQGAVSISISQTITVTSKGKITTAALGGYGGAGGKGGNHGNYDKNGTDRSGIQAASGINGATGLI